MAWKTYKDQVNSYLKQASVPGAAQGSAQGSAQGALSIKNAVGGPQNTASGITTQTQQQAAGNGVGPVRLYSGSAGTGGTSSTGSTAGQPVGIRSALTGQYGLDNAKIGYSDGWVTYDGKNLLRPDWVDEDAGISYVNDPSKIYSAVASFGADGRTPVRPALTDLGLADSRIGWDDGWVTYDGKRILPPDAVENGVSYVNNRADAVGAAMNAYKNSGVNVVKATEYAANKGYPFDVSYNGQTGTISVAGVTIRPLFVEGDTAYVDSADIDSAINAAMAQSGIQSGSDILGKYQEKYDPYYDRLIDAMVNQGPFSYDPESDVVFQGYRDQYNREGDRAMRDMVGQMSGMTGGYANSAAMTAGAQQRQYWSDQLMDRIPELAQAAYERYLGDYNRNVQTLGAISDLAQRQYENEYGMNRDLIGDVRENYEIKRNRENDAAEAAYREQRDAADDDYRNREFGLSKQESDANAESTKLSNDAKRIENWYNGFISCVEYAQRTNQWPPEAAEVYGIDPAADPWAYDIRQLEIQRNNELATYQGKAGIDTDEYMERGTFDTEQNKDIIGAQLDADKELAEFEYGLKNQYAGGGSGGSGGSSGGGSKSSKSSQSSTPQSVSTYGNLIGNEFKIYPDGTGYVILQSPDGSSLNGVSFQYLKEMVDNGEVIEKTKNGKYYYIKIS